MTAAAVKPEWPRPSRLVPFLARYKKGHVFEGMHVERGRFCENCRGRFFPQQVINPDYCAALSETARKSFLQSCELEKMGRAIVAWFPQFCHRCVRRSL